MDLRTPVTAVGAGIAAFLVVAVATIQLLPVGIGVAVVAVLLDRRE